MSARFTAAMAANGSLISRTFVAAIGAFALSVVVTSSAAVNPAMSPVVNPVVNPAMNPAMNPAVPLHRTESASSTEPIRLAQIGSRNVGQRVYEKWCAPCHAPGPDHPGTTALAALYKGTKPPALTDRTDLTPPVVKQFVRHGVSVMPFFRKTEISDAELDALAAFLSKG